jgi:two-component system, OmpR family, response regulator
VLFLTARDAVPDRLAGFSAGGDDYVTKPFHFDEVVARLRALLRRSAADVATTVGELRLDPVAHAISAEGGEASLTPTEFRVLAALAAQPGAVVRRRELVRAAWPDGAIVHDNTLDQYVARLRRKLREVSAEAGIATAHGVGYRLE